MTKSPILLRDLRKFYPKLIDVIDATSNLAVDVSPNDIENSIRKDPTLCALAIACRRSKDVDFVIASRSRMYVIHKRIAVRYMLPETALREIVSFDRGAEFTPGVYNLRVSSDTSRLGQSSHRGGPNVTNNKEAKSRYRAIQNIRVSLTEG